MRNALKWVVGAVGAIILISILTCPNEADYYKWLSKEYNIICVNTGFGDECRERGAEIEWKSRAVKSAWVFMSVKEEYIQANTDYQIQAVGVFNHFFDYSKISVYD
ncbi:hypothetical protein [Paenibacillus herberti]|uniref:DUF4359 domain-containing protein n=1 Tax=Paenibacillus herberti TaxID=1619309 RepID=A0A229NZ99_9BACL|nr:hypothetical protein [Paenibacillus herberti]OXM15177.1 hypothetical protein CGZ75_00025 [Paenibacillus herberti]